MFGYVRSLCGMRPSKWERLNSDLAGIKGQLKSIKTTLDDMEDSYEEYAKDTAANALALKHELKQKTQFIENLFSNILESRINGDNGHANGKGGDMIDLSLLDAATQNIVKNKLKNLATAKRLP